MWNVVLVRASSVGGYHGRWPWQLKGFAVGAKLQKAVAPSWWGHGYMRLKTKCFNLWNGPPYLAAAYHWAHDIKKKSIQVWKDVMFPFNSLLFSGQYHATLGSFWSQETVWAVRMCKIMLKFKEYMVYKLSSLQEPSIQFLMWIMEESFPYRLVIPKWPAESSSEASDIRNSHSLDKWPLSNSLLVTSCSSAEADPLPHLLCCSGFQWLAQRDGWVSAPKQIPS